jgi:uncharacterized tellurite resistance protein B-like protein
MFDRLIGVLTGDANARQAHHPDRLQIAVGALLVEAAQMDGTFDANEQAAIKRILAERYKLTPWEAEALFKASEQARDASTQLFAFSNTIVHDMEPEDRAQIIEMLWEVAYSDGHLDAEEDALIRKVAGLIYVTDRDRGEARKRALARLGRTNVEVTLAADRGNEHKSFVEGYIDGWTSIESAPIPPIPAFTLPAGKTEYEHGYEQGRALAGGK